VQNHPFVDGNRRSAELAMTVFLDLNGNELVEDEDATPEMFESVATGVVDQREFLGWVVNHAKPKARSNMLPMSGTDD